MAESLRDKSRRNWVNEQDSNENIQLGCMLRIADATELMAKRYADLINERDQAKRSAEYWRACSDRRERSNRSLRGQITKLKNQLAEARAAQEQGGSDV